MIKKAFLHFYLSSTLFIFLKENRTLFKAAEDSDAWSAYKAYVDDMVVDGCFNMVESTLDFFLQQTSPVAKPQPPLFEARLELEAPDMVFT